MSSQLISRNDDLRQLRDEGYSIRIVGGRLVVEDIPFIDSGGVVRETGILVTALELGGDKTVPPTDHTAWFVGGVPHDTAGRPIHDIFNNDTDRTDFGEGMVASCYFSAKPDGGYTDYHHKVTTYVGYILGQAAVLSPTATARPRKPVLPDADGSDGPFHYIDTASSRAGITALNEVLSDERVAIVGLGGTGEYILDFVAKTQAPEIHIFDGDDFLTHNAFRAPGAPSLSQLNERPLKVNHFGELYDNMHKGLIRHPFHITAANTDELATMTFVFVAIDDPPAKAPIIAALLDMAIPFVDVGMGIELRDGQLVGSLRTTTSTPDKHDHVHERIATVEAGAADDYRSNIQIAELNALNACIAVIAWKKMRGIYADDYRPHNSMYVLARNSLINDEQTAPVEVAADEAA